MISTGMWAGLMMRWLLGDKETAYLREINSSFTYSTVVSL